MTFAQVAPVLPPIENQWQFFGFLVIFGWGVYQWWDNRIQMRLAAEKAAADKVDVKQDLHVLSVNVDGKLASYIEAVAKGSHAEGKIEGISEERVTSTAAAVAVAAAAAAPAPEIAVIQAQNQASINDRAQIHAEIATITAGPDGPRP